MVKIPGSNPGGCTRPYPPSRQLIPPWPEELELTPKELLNLLVDLNERWGGRFTRVVDELHLAIDQLWDEG